MEKGEIWPALGIVRITGTINSPPPFFVGGIMNPRCYRFCWAAMLMLCTAPVALAEVNIVPSLEWMCCSAEVIVIGKISKVDATPGPGDVTYEDCLVNIQQ